MVESPRVGDESTAIVLLAGGEARRFPGKLECIVDGLPMLAHCLGRAKRSGWPVYVSGKGSFAGVLDRMLDAPLLIDRRPGAGPLAALVSACTVIRADRVFAIAADQPQLDPAVLRTLAGSWHDGDEALVPRHAGGVEPLAALYARRAILREATGLRRSGKSAMRDLLQSVAARFVPIDAAYFRNVNFAEDLA